MKLAVLALGCSAVVAGLLIALNAASVKKGSGEVLLILDRTELHKGQRTLKYTVVNKLQERIGFGEPYDIQKLCNGEWISVEWMKDRVWILILYTLMPGESFSRVVELPENIEPGEYRLVKEVMVGEDERKVVLTAGFTVLS